MPASKKFLFDRSFDPPDIPPVAAVVEELIPEEPEIVIPTFSEEELAHAREEAFANGREEGVREAAEATEREILQTIQTIDSELTRLISQQKIANGSIFRDSIDVAAGIVRKCFPHLNSDQSMHEIESIVSETLVQVIDEPRVVISIHPDLQQNLSQRLDSITGRVHFEGRISIRPDADIATGDCRIEWSNGGAERNMTDLWQQIDEVVKTNLSSTENGIDIELREDTDSMSSVISETPTPDQDEQNSATADTDAIDTTASTTPAGSPAEPDTSLSLDQGVVPSTAPVQSE